MMRAYWFSLRRAAIVAGLIAIVPFAAAQTPPAPAGNAPRYAPNGDLLAPTGFEKWIFVGSRSRTGLQAGPAGHDRGGVRARREAGVSQRLSHAGSLRAVPAKPDGLPRRHHSGDGAVRGRRQGAERHPVGRVVQRDEGRHRDRREEFDAANPTASAWAYYDFTDPADPTKLRPQARPKADAACANCHRDHAGPDNVWVRLYPVLRGFLP